MVFVEPTEIPSISRKKGKNWLEILNKIPVGQTWVLPEDNGTYKLSSVKSGMDSVNKEAKKTLFEAKQRTVEGKLHLYVTRLE